MVQLSIFISVMSFIFGTCIGSFLNVVIYRMPEGQSIVSPPSHCPACNHPIAFYFNLPIISFLILKGKCKFCKAPISIRYPLVELLTGVLALGLFFKFGLTPAALFYFTFGAVLIAISFIDLDYQIIPDKLSLPGIIIFSTSCVFVPQMRFVSVIWGILAGGGVLYLVAFSYYYLRKRQGMGGGDIKLLAMIGAATGVKGVLFTLFTGSVFGTLGGVAAMALAGKSEKRQAKIPFGPFLSLGAMLYVFRGESIIRWYIDFLK
ncbi:prepilin peptidase [Desulfobacter vibrioformis]|uniref:prepilin peptidase n=1 Tax=Desulfobacter vibrioformis TaxID=34031 RepID=UPI0005515467|nr:A24 family peptidase [Desulfobacter vibrioformis]